MWRARRSPRARSRLFPPCPIEGSSEAAGAQPATSRRQDCSTSRLRSAISIRAAPRQPMRITPQESSCCSCFISGWHPAVLRPSPRAIYGRKGGGLRCGGGAGCPGVARPPRAVYQPPRRPHRLEAQDGALSRLKPGFESPWGRHYYQIVSSLPVTSLLDVRQKYGMEGQPSLLGLRASFPCSSEVVSLSSPDPSTRS